jgi:hypothetical protein
MILVLYENEDHQMKMVQKKYNKCSDFSFSEETGMKKWKWCKINETTVMILVLWENEHHQMKMMAKKWN